MPMQLSYFLYRCLIIIPVLAAILCTSCTTTGPAVEVVSDKEQVVEELEEDKQSKVKEAISKQEKKQKNASVPSSLQQAPSLSAREYIKKYAREDPTQGKYTLGPDDVISIRVYNNQDLSNESITVSGDGKIKLPLLGNIEVAGLTPPEVEDLITRKLVQNKYLNDPQISVQIQKYQSKEILVLGTVKNPGTYTLKGAESVLDLISRAGGIDFSTGGQNLTLVRTENSPEKGNHKVAIKINLNKLLDGKQQYADLLLQNKDIIYVPAAEKYTIMGEVEDPGDYTIDNGGISIVQAVGKAGGYTRIAAPNRTKIIRSTSDNRKVIQVDMNVLTEQSNYKDMVQIKPNDIIIVPESYF
mgnify:FL=1